ncbi:MAG TPA: trehalase-like domain-containing protein, partial [Pseudonocardiaceae bacterium]|nr:trehalase-like domain-containing protein [Pseudonocardiaceae bacterium]
MADQDRMMWRPQPHVLRGYALLADGERGALVGQDGHVTWLCVPRWHHEPVFATLVGGRGSYQVAPVDTWSVWSGSYEPGTLIWRGRWTTSDSAVECWDALALPGDEHTAVLLRRIVTTDAPVRMAVALTPRAGFTDRGMTDLGRRNGTWTARLGSLYLRWTGAPDAVVHGADDQLGLIVDVPAGQHHDLVLEMSDQPVGQDPPRPDLLWRATRTRWQARVPAFADTLAPRDTRHAYAVLRGLTSATGGMVAAATTSLPERQNGGGNYDYRYAWIRDQAWVGQAIATHGPHSLVTDAVE